MYQTWLDAVCVAAPRYMPVFPLKVHTSLLAQLCTQLYVSIRLLLGCMCFGSLFILLRFSVCCPSWGLVGYITRNNIEWFMHQLELASFERDSRTCGTILRIGPGETPPSPAKYPNLTTRVFGFPCLLWMIFELSSRYLVVWCLKFVQHLQGPRHRWETIPVFESFYYDFGRVRFNCSLCTPAIFRYLCYLIIYLLS